VPTSTTLNGSKIIWGRLKGTPVQRNRIFGEVARQRSRIAEMANYRLFLIGLDGYLVGSTCVTCPSDAEALAKGDDVLRTFYATVEVWDGSRRVGHLESHTTSHDEGLTAP
jgi:hypothetical protein